MASRKDELLGRMDNLLGPLGPDEQVRVRKLLVNPSAETWNDAYGLIVNAKVMRRSTLWQCVMTVDAQCPTVLPTDTDGPDKWDGYYPTPFTVLRALELAQQEVRP